jgi:hypothetical protein
MTRKELEHVKKVLLNIKPRENGMGIHGQVQLAIALVEKDIARRIAEHDNFKHMYEYADEYPW